MNAALKNAIEWSLIALLVGAVCLGLLIVGNNGEEEISALRASLLSLGIAAALVAHWVFMAQVLKLSGRRLLPWLVALVIFTPLGSVVLLARVMSGNKASQAG